MKNGMIFGVTVPVMLVFGSGLALAGTAMPAQQVPQQSAKMPVDQQELDHFAAAVKEIQPIDMKAHHVMASKSMNKDEKHEKLTSYDKQITAVLAQHHLTPEKYEMLLKKYEMLLKKAQADPTFAKRTETALQKMG